MTLPATDFIFLCNHAGSFRAKSALWRTQPRSRTFFPLHLSMIKDSLSTGFAPLIIDSSSSFSIGISKIYEQGDYLGSEYHCILHGPASSSFTLSARATPGDHPLRALRFSYEPYISSM